MENRDNLTDVHKINNYLDIAETMITKTCTRNNYGCVIVKNDKIISTGFTKAPLGRDTCCKLGYCLRKKLGLPSGKGYDQCRSVHAEWKAIISASEEDLIGSTLYLVGINGRTDQYVDDNAPCSICKRMLIEARVETVVMRDTKEKYRIEKVSDWVVNDDTLYNEPDTPKNDDTLNS